MSIMITNKPGTSSGGTSSSNFSLLLQNLGLSTSVSANALTIALKQQDGSTDPAAAPNNVIIGTRSSTSSSGAYNLRSVTSALSITVPSGASLGQTSGVNQYVWVYALDNAGTIELAVSGVKLFDDSSVQSTTAITSGSTSGTVLYSTTARTSVPIRLIGRLLSNQTTAGTWATGMSEVADVTGKQSVTMTDYDTTTYVMAPSASFGTPANSKFYTRRVGDSLEVLFSFTTGSSTASTSSLVLSGLTIDFTKVVGGSPVAQGIVGSFTNADPSGTTTGVGSGNATGILMVDGINNTMVFPAISTASGAYNKINGNALSNSGSLMSGYIRLPIVGWSKNGP